MRVLQSAIGTAGLTVILLSSPAMVWAQQPAPAPAETAQQLQQAEQAKPDAQMQAVLDALKGLDANPFRA